MKLGKIKIFKIIFAVLLAGWFYNIPSANFDFLTTPRSAQFLAGHIFEIQKAYAATTTIFLTATSTTSWNIPSDWSNFNSIEVIGGGGGGGSSANLGDSGGGGGAYAKINNFDVGASTTILVQVGVGGAQNASGTLSFWGGSGAVTTCTGKSVCADFGGRGVTSTVSKGGTTANSSGTITYAGGNGGAGNTTGDTGGGGGGAGGPLGAGAAGGNGGASTGSGGGGGGGSGGSGAGGIGQNASSSAGNGGRGGNGPGGSGGGAGGNATSGIAATAGSGGGGGAGDNDNNGRPGATYTEWDSTHGSGGGGGGSADAHTGIANDTSMGGLYGGGGGGADAAGAWGKGGDGIIVIQYTPKATFEHSAYKWYTNSNSSTVGAELATGIQDASTTLTSTGSAFRLRLLLHVTNNSSTPGVDTLKLQYTSTTPGNCSPDFYGNSAFTDVSTSAGEIRYNGNALPSDGDLLGATSTDPTHGGDTIVNQTYEEQNNFTTTSTIGIGRDGRWDFSLIDFSAPGGTTYCFRVVKSDGNTITTSTSSKIPEIKSFPTNSAPTVSSVSLNHGNSITLNPNATTSFDINYTITDNDGCGEINTNLATSTAFRSGSALSCAVPSPTTSSLNCYLYVTRATSTCSGNSINATDTVQIYYFAQATDSSSSYTAQHWESFAMAVDTNNATGSATSSAVELNTLTAINVTTSSINYGTVDASSTTGGVNQIATTTNAGNSSTTLQLKASATLTLGSNSIPTSSQRYATSTFTFPGNATQLTESDVTVTGFFLLSPTSTTAVAQSTYWGIEVPAGLPTGTYSGIIVFSSLFQP